MTRLNLPFRALLAVLMLAVAAACDEVPTETLEQGGVSFAKGKPVDCGESVPLSISLGTAPGDALQNDDRGAYVEGVENVGAHLNGPTGNLMLWTSQYGATSRFVKVATSAFTGQTTDRIFTNTHDNPGGTNACGLKGMKPGTTGSAVLVAELGDTGDGFVTWGQGCDGTDRIGNRVVTTFSADSTTWTITGPSGVHCKRLSNRKNVPPDSVGAAGPFSMTLVRN